MKYFALVLIIAVTGLATGCATNRGGKSDQFDATANGAQAYPEPAASPTERPGMNPRDPRDPQFTTHSDPADAAKP
jgi:hypothetical protein